MRRIISVVIISLLFVFLVGAGSSDTISYEGLDLVLVIDCSGSMKKTDPNKNARIATEHIVNKLGNTSRLGIVFFGGEATSVPLTYGLEKDIIFRLINEKYHQNDLYTNIPKALEMALELFDGSSTNKKAIILLTDGDDDPLRSNYRDLEQKDLDLEALKPLREQIKQKAQTADIPIYPIGLSVDGSIPEAFEPILEAFAKETGADRARSANSSQQIIDYFDEIFNMLRGNVSEKEIIGPFDGDSWLTLPKDMPPYVTLAHISITSDAEFEVRFRNPDGIIIDEYTYAPRNEGYNTSYYIDEPEEGPWNIEVKGKRGYFAEIELDIDNSLIAAMTVNGDSGQYFEIKEEDESISFDIYFEVYGQRADLLSIYDAVKNISLVVSNAENDAIVYKYEKEAKSEKDYQITIDKFPIGEYKATAMIEHKYFTRDSVPVVLVVMADLEQEEPAYTPMPPKIDFDFSGNSIPLLIWIPIIAVICIVIYFYLDNKKKILFPDDTTIALDIIIAIDETTRNGGRFQKSIGSNRRATSLGQLEFGDDICKVIRQQLPRGMDFNENKIEKYLKSVKIEPKQDGNIKVYDKRSAGKDSSKFRKTFINAIKRDDDEINLTIDFTVTKVEKNI